MLVHFKFSNYKSFKNETVLDMRTKKGNCYTFKTTIPNYGNILRTMSVYGANASGKTKLFEALKFFKSVVAPPINEDMPMFKYWQSKYDNFKLSTETEDKNSIFEVEFVVDNIAYNYSIEINRERIIKETLNKKEGRWTNVFKRNDNHIDYNSTYIEDDIVNNIKNNNWPKSYTTYIYALSNYENAIGKIVTNWFDNIIIISSNDKINPQEITKDPNIKKAILAFMKDLDISIEDIALGSRKTSEISEKIDKKSNYAFDEMSEVLETTHYKYNEYNERISKEKFVLEKDESFGTYRIMNLALPILQTIGRNGVLLIDEFDCGIHPNLLQAIISMFYMGGCKAQLLINTQNTTLLTINRIDTDNKSIKTTDELFSKDQVVLVSKDDYGVSTLIPLTDYHSSLTRGNKEDKLLNGIFEKGIPYIGLGTNISELQEELNRQRAEITRQTQENRQLLDQQIVLENNYRDKIKELEPSSFAKDALAVVGGIGVIFGLVSLFSKK